MLHLECRVLLGCRGFFCTRIIVRSSFMNGRPSQGEFGNFSLQYTVSLPSMKNNFPNTIPPYTNT